MPYKPVDTAIICVVGPLIDDSDFKSPETSIAYDAAGMSVDWIQEETDGTYTKTDLTLTTGGTQDWTHIGNGYYAVEITAAQNGLEGMGWVCGVCTGVLLFESPHYDIVPTKVYASLVTGTDNLEVDAVYIEGADPSDTINAACDTAIETYDLDHLIHTAEDNTPADNSIIAKLVSKDATADWSDYSNQTDSLEALRDRGDSAWVTATGFSTHSAGDVKTAIEAAGSSIAAILADTDELQTNQGDWATATGFSTFDASTDEVDIGAVKGVAVTSVDDFKADVSGLSTLTAGDLPSEPPSAGTIADAVWDEAAADHVSAGTFGKLMLAFKTLLGHKSIENSESTSVTFRTAGDAGDAGTQSWDEDNKTRGEYTGF